MFRADRLGYESDWRLGNVLPRENVRVILTGDVDVASSNCECGSPINNYIFIPNRKEA
jgi:hypothetical protein